MRITRQYTKPNESPYASIQFRLDPEGLRIAFTAGEAQSEIWVMKNFLPMEHASR